jgi:hypothetical protein
MWIFESSALAAKSPHPPSGPSPICEGQTGEGEKPNAKRNILSPSPARLRVGEGGRRPDEGSWPQATNFDKII